MTTKHLVKTLALTLLALAGFSWIDRQIKISDRKYDALTYRCTMDEGFHRTHRVVEIERRFYDGDKDGKYDSELSFIKFNDGCQELRKLPCYVLGRTKEYYEEVFRNPIDVELDVSIEPEVLKDIKQTLIFK